MQKAIILIKKERSSDVRGGHSLARELAWECLERLTGGAAEQLQEQGVSLVREQSGRPVWKGIQAELSISHTGAFAAAAVSTVRIGIDLEPLNRERLRVAKRMFSLKEQEWLMCQKAAGRTDGFSQLWTLRESYAKWTGLGLAKMPSVEFLPTENKILCSDGSCQAKSLPFIEEGLMFSLVADAGYELVLEIC